MFLLTSKQLYWAAHTTNIFDQSWAARDLVISVCRGIKWGSSGIRVGLPWKVLILSYYSTSIPDSQLSEAKKRGGGEVWGDTGNGINGTAMNLKPSSMLHSFKQTSKGSSRCGCCSLDLQRCFPSFRESSQDMSPLAHRGTRSKLSRREDTQLTQHWWFLVKALSVF